MKPYYQRAGVTLYHADCRDVLPEIVVAGGGGVLVTDPPYGIGFAAQPTKWQRRAGAKPVDWDDNVVNDVPRIAAMFAEAVVWGGNYYDLPPSRGWLAWVKPDAPPSMGTFELAWTSRDTIVRHFVWSIGATNAERLGHPTQKPVRVMTWTLGFVGSGLIVDPFAGSGTTLAAALTLGRDAVGIELDERYCEIAAKRLDALTAQGVLFGGAA